MRYLLLFICLICSFETCLASADTNHGDITIAQSKYQLGSEQNPIKIGLMVVDPYITKHDGVYQGLLIDYWKQISKDKNWHYKFIETTPNYTNVLKDAAIGKYDLVLGNFSTTAGRISYINYSRPFMLNKISILTTNNDVNAFTILVNVFYAIIEILLTVFLLVSFVACALRICRSDEDNTTLIEFFLIAADSMLGSVVVNRFTKAIFLMLLFVSLIVKAIFIGSVTSTLFNLSLSSKEPFADAKDISGKLFVVVKGSSYVVEMRALNARVYEFDGSDEEAAAFYARNTAKYDGYVSDFALIFKYANQFKSVEPNLIVSNYNVRNDILAFVYNEDFAFQKIIDINILELQDSNLAYSICSVYIGEEAKDCVM